MVLFNQAHLTNDLMNWADWLHNYRVLRVMDIHWSYQDLLFWAGIIWCRLSANQIVRYFKLKKLKSYMKYQVDFLLPLKLQKICYFGLFLKILLANQFTGFFTFDLFDLLILIPGVHCYIVFVGSAICELVLKLTMMTPRRVIQLESCIN